MFSFFAMVIFSIFEWGEAYTYFPGYGPIQILAMAMSKVDWFFDEVGLDAPWLLNFIALGMILTGLGIGCVITHALSASFTSMLP